MEGHENTQKYCTSYFDSKTWAGSRGPPSGGYFGVSLDIGRVAITVAYIIIIAVFQQLTASDSDGPSILNPKYAIECSTWYEIKSLSFWLCSSPGAIILP